LRRPETPSDPVILLLRQGRRQGAAWAVLLVYENVTP